MIDALEAREREAIRHDLESPDEEVRRLAVERLGTLPGAEALPRLVEGLGDEAWRVRKAVVERLAGAPGAWDVPAALTEALADGDNPGRRNAAVEALIRCGRNAVPALLEASRRSDADVRKLVVDALAGIGDPRATQRLLELLDDADPNVRAAAADALGAVGDLGASEALLRVAVHEQDDTLVRLAALWALARLDTPVTAAQLGGALDEGLLRPAAFAVLGRVDDGDAEGHLLKGLQSGSRATREAAMEALLRLMARDDAGLAEQRAARIRAAVAAAPEALRDASERVIDADLGTRLVLAQFLGLVGGDVTLPLLRSARDEAITEVAFGALVELGERAEQAIATVWERLDPELRRLACQLLGRTAGQAGRTCLLRALDDADGELRAIAAQAVGRRQEVTAVRSLLRRLERAARHEGLDGEEEREALVQALVAIAQAPGATGAEATRETVAYLGPRLQEADEAVRHALARVLAAVSGPDHLPIVGALLRDPSPAVRRAGVQALGRLGEVAREPLRLALADESPGVRVAAAAALGAGDPSALDDLERLLEDEAVRVRAAAVRAIGEVLRRSRPARGQTPATAATARAVALLERSLQEAGPVALTALEGLQASAAPEAARAVRALLSHPDAELLQAAVRCLGCLDDAAQVEELIPLVGHDQWAVRAEALQVLGERRVVRAVPAILRRLEIEQDDFVREIILRALARLDA